MDASSWLALTVGVLVLLPPLWLVARPRSGDSKGLATGKRMLAAVAVAVFAGAAGFYAAVLAMTNADGVPRACAQNIEQSCRAEMLAVVPWAERQERLGVEAEAHVAFQRCIFRGVQ